MLEGGFGSGLIGVLIPRLAFAILYLAGSVLDDLSGRERPALWIGESIAKEPKT